MKRPFLISDVELAQSYPTEIGFFSATQTDRERPLRADIFLVFYANDEAGVLAAGGGGNGGRGT